MSVDASVLQYIEDDEWRVLTAVELGMRNHEYVATELIHSIAALRGTIHHILATLARHRLIHHVGKPYDGYTLTKLGYDYLALHTLVKRGAVATLGQLIGRGKEADVYTGFDEDGAPIIIKFHRLGRVSFKKAKHTRDYLRKANGSSWLYFSRLSAVAEFKNMQLLKGFPIPTPIEQNRHCVVMTHINGTLLNSISSIDEPGIIFNKIMNIAIDMLRAGYVHADYSEFNILLSENGEVTVIDFPQCIPYDHHEAEEKFDHDLDELRRFFSLKFDYIVESIPKFADYLDEITMVKLESEEEEKTEMIEDNEEEHIQFRVSKENRFRRKAVKKNMSKNMNRLKKEARTYL